MDTECLARNALVTKAPRRNYTNTNQQMFDQMVWKVRKVVSVVWESVWMTH